MVVVGCGNAVNGTLETICVIDSTETEKCIKNCTFNDLEKVFICFDENIKLCINTPMVAYPTICMESKDCKISKDGTFECNYLWNNKCLNEPCVGKCKQCNAEDEVISEDLTCYEFKSGESQCLDWCGMYNTLQEQMWDETCYGLSNECPFCRCWTSGMMYDGTKKACVEYNPRYLCWSEYGNTTLVRSQYNGLLRDKASGIVDVWRQTCIDSDN